MYDGFGFFRYKRGMERYSCYVVAERAGFEHAIRGNRIPLFESGAFNHSATSP